jgi:cyanophycinase-like exopeptidase
VNGEERLPRLLTIMGSGETAPTMIKVHRTVVERLGRGQPPGLLLDTPFGFQTNAAEIAARAVTYFRDSVGAPLEVAGLRSRADLQGPSGDAIVARLAAAPFVFAGPGSPTYALRNWRDTLVPGLLAEKLTLGGAVTFASAAALTLGVVTVPVYEIYKVGEDPSWAQGLDLLGPLGLPIALIPHYDNAEGGTHDTRFCYLGEERLSRLERELPERAFVVGVDEHTALLIDLDTQSAEVVGHGAVTVRVQGRSARIEGGETVPFGRFTELAAQLATTADGTIGIPGPASAGDSVRDAASGFRPTSQQESGPPLLVAIRVHEDAYRVGRDRSDATAMAQAILALDDELWAWSADTLQSDALDRGRSSLRAMVDELGRVAEQGTRDPAAVVRPFVELALSLRESARRERRFGESDAVRDRLETLGIEVRDTADGSAWALSERVRSDPRRGGTPGTTC